jgi:hypothetical protein
VADGKDSWVKKALKIFAFCMNYLIHKDLSKFWITVVSNSTFPWSEPKKKRLALDATLSGIQ